MNKGDLTPFAEMFLNLVDISMKQLYDEIKNKLDKFNFYCNLCPKLPNANHKDIIKELEIGFKVSYSSVRNKLSYIPDELLIKNTRERHAYYMLDLDKVDIMFSK